MPIYEYKCEHCHKTFEILQKVNEEPLSECILCHKGSVKKLMSVSSFVLKGAGFYVNDYPSESRKNDKKESTSTSTNESTSKSNSGSTSTKKEKSTAKAS
ncbi:FmdB family transcriptional regulator [candidate division KSB3 bacterium]|uniref:FmdB family transcriptional regulator n=1 Tax=candidate division KSB3 bacterium TaxID=2044937 RepID=A0A2G6KCQ9_9BACT|nr:MAG: FmdB family transcriptional regulator [candidate division KSB3 bacterium]